MLYDREDASLAQRRIILQLLRVEHGAGGNARALEPLHRLVLRAFDAPRRNHSIDVCVWGAPGDIACAYGCECAIALLLIRGRGHIAVVVGAATFAAIDVAIAKS